MHSVTGNCIGISLDKRETPYATREPVFSGILLEAAQQSLRSEILPPQNLEIAGLRWI
jgi:hypothetical protein